MSKLYKNVSIYPKEVDRKKLSEFTPAEKRKLVRKGFRWYVYYSYFNPNTGKFEKQKPIYASANSRFKTFDSRYDYIHGVKKSLLKILKEGYSPYEEIKENTVGECIERALKFKESDMSAKTYANFKSQVNKFITYIRSKGIWNSPIKTLNRKFVIEFLNYVQSKNTKATRNSYRNTISSLFTAMVDLEHIEVNFVRDIELAKTKPKAHQTYTNQQQKEIFDYLELHHKKLLFFIRFFTFSVIRPIDAVRIKIKHINIDEKYFILKQSKRVDNIRKSIPNALLELMPDLSGLDSEMYLFGREGVPGFWDSAEEHRRGFFSKWFKKEVKDELKLPKDLTMYGFRHTLISSIFNQKLAELKSFDKALEETQKITEHRSRESLMKYLRNINAITREDYSKYLY